MPKLIKKLDTFLKLPKGIRRLFVEAMVISAGVKFCLLFFPFKYVLRWMGAALAESGQMPDEASLPVRKNIKSALQLCCKYTPWRTECYTLALTGKLMLKRRNISSTLYLGFIKDGDGKRKGHAWLRACDTYIAGYRESAGYPVNFTFS
jgi:hypothetical protein